VTVENSAIGLMPLLYDDVNGMIPAQLYVANRAKVDAEYYQSEVLRLLKHQL